MERTGTDAAGRVNPFVSNTAPDRDLDPDAVDDVYRRLETRDDLPTVDR